MKVCHSLWMIGIQDVRLVCRLWFVNAVGGTANGTFTQKPLTLSCRSNPPARKHKMQKWLFSIFGIG